jgi:hypothetical protein
MIVNTPQGLKEIKRLDYATDVEFYRAIVLARFGMTLPSVPSFGEKIKG